jgi:hypothetical protein
MTEPKLLGQMDVTQGRSRLVLWLSNYIWFGTQKPRRVFPTLIWLLGKANTIGSKKFGCAYSASVISC